MPFMGQGRGSALSRIRPRVLKTGEKMGLPWDAYYVLTKANARLTNSKIHPNTGAPNYNVKHGFSDLTADADLDFGSYDITDVTDITMLGNLILPATSSTVGNIMVSTDRFIHFYGAGAFIGKNAGNYTLTGTHPVGIGEGALASLTDGNDNMAIGYNALNSCTEGIANTAVGNNALAACVDGDYNLALGNNSLSLNTGTGRNVALGNEALAASTTASHNVAVGASALRLTSGGADNVAIGSSTGGNNETGVQNVFIGKGAGQGPATPTNLSLSVMVGFGAGAQETNDERLYIANSNTTTPLIYGEFDTPLLRFHAPTTVNALAAGDDDIMFLVEQNGTDRFRIYGDRLVTIGRTGTKPAGSIGLYVTGTADTEPGGAVEALVFSQLLIPVDYDAPVGNESANWFTSIFNKAVVNIRNLYGSLGQVQVYADADVSGTVGVLAGNEGQIYFSTTSPCTETFTIGEAAGVRGRIHGNSGNCTITDGYGGYFLYPAANVTVTNRFALKAEGFTEIESSNTTDRVNLCLDQNNIDQSFIDYEGTSAADTSRSISTMHGDGVAAGPNASGLGRQGWVFVGMVKTDINGTEYWMPYFTPDVAP